MTRGPLDLSIIMQQEAKKAHVLGHTHGSVRSAHAAINLAGLVDPEDDWGKPSSEGGMI